MSRVCLLTQLIFVVVVVAIAQSTKLGPGSYDLLRYNSFDETNVARRAEGPNWERAMLTERLAKMPYLLYREMFKKKQEDVSHVDPFCSLNFECLAFTVFVVVVVVVFVVDCSDIETTPRSGLLQRVARGRDETTLDTWHAGRAELAISHRLDAGLPGSGLVRRAGREARGEAQEQAGQGARHGALQGGAFVAARRQRGGARHLYAQGLGGRAAQEARVDARSLRRVQRESLGAHQDRPLRRGHRQQARPGPVREDGHHRRAQEGPVRQARQVRQDCSISDRRRRPLVHRAHVAKAAQSFLVSVVLLLLLLFAISSIFNTDDDVLGHHQ